jgi:hypothetical protein
MFKMRAFECMEEKKGERWWRDDGVGALLREGRRNSGEVGAGGDDAHPLTLQLGSLVSPEVTAEALRSITHKLRAKSRQIHSLTSTLEKSRPRTGTCLESYCCNVAWADTVKTIKRELEEEKERALERQYVYSISTYFNSLVELTRAGVGMVEEEGKSEALIKTLKIEMGRRKDIIDWVEQLGGGTDCDWEGFNRAMRGLGAAGAVAAYTNMTNDSIAKQTGFGGTVTDITEEKLLAERKKVKGVLDRLESAIEEFCPYTISRKK